MQKIFGFWRDPFFQWSRSSSFQNVSSSSGFGFYYDMIYLLTAVGLTPGDSSTVHIYTQTIQRTTQFTNWEECGPCPVFARYTLAFALQLRKKHGKTLSQNSISHVWCLSWARRTHFSPSHSIYLRSTLIPSSLSLSLFLDFKGVFSPQLCPPKLCLHFSSSSCVPKPHPASNLPCNHPDAIYVKHKTQPHVHTVQQKKTRNITVHGKSLLL